MASRPVRFRALALADFDGAVPYFVEQGGSELGARFIDAIERTIAEIGRRPLLGSLRFAYELEIPDVRVQSAGRFPYLVFCVVSVDSVDVWRILHSRRDIGSLLGNHPDD